MFRFNPITGKFDYAPTQSEKPGPQGEPGLDGVDGADGRDGVDGIDGKDGRDGIDGMDGAPGERGPTGIGILSGTVPPEPEDGEPGSFYIDHVQWMIYGPKLTGYGWPNGVSLIGPRGNDGRDGRDGLDGLDGEDGRDGRDGKDGVVGPRGPRGEPGPPGRTVAEGSGVLRSLGSSGIRVQTN